MAKVQLEGTLTRGERLAAAAAIHIVRLSKLIYSLLKRVTDSVAFRLIALALAVAGAWSPIVNLFPG